MVFTQMARRMSCVKEHSYSIPSDHDKWKLEVAWLLEHYGPIGERWDYNGGLFFFNTEKDKMVFVIARA